MAGAGEPADLVGTVAAAFFLGDRTRLFVDVGDRQPLVVESMARCTLQLGEAVHMLVDPQGVLDLSSHRASH
ncbi:MAG: hypothetical protein C0607_08895 [Azoarcus sp.]|nr:MAG: hypothetical protein C0607_08895 [Azoarcus sp.]